MRIVMDLPLAFLTCFLLIYPALAFSPRLDNWISRAMTREQMVQQIGKPPCVSCHLFLISVPCKLFCMLFMFSSAVRILVKSNIQEDSNALVMYKSFAFRLLLLGWTC